MRSRIALIAAALLAGSPLLAQTPVTAPPKPPAHQPGVPAARPASPPADSQSATPGAAADKIDPAKEAAIRHLMDLTQTSKMGEDLNAYVTKQVREALGQALTPDRLAKFMQTFGQKLDAATPSGAITDAIVPVYARAFSMDDIVALNQFYESPLGQRLVKTLPQVSQESQRLGVKIEQSGALSVLQDMSSDYPELKSMLGPPSGAGADAAPGSDRSAAPAPSSAPPAK